MVIVTRREYENLRMPGSPKKKVKEFEPTKTQKEILKKARLNRAKGNFLTLGELKQKLGFTN